MISDSSQKFVLCQVYDETDNCVPFKIDNNGMKISTIQSTFYYLMITRQKLLADYYSTNNEKILDKARIKGKMLMNLIKAKRNFYKHNKHDTLSNDNPFQEFVVSCLGPNVTALRKRNLVIQERKKDKKPLRYRYEPKAKNNQVDFLRLDDFTGNEIKKKENLTIKN